MAAISETKKLTPADRGRQLAGLLATASQEFIGNCFERNPILARTGNPNETFSFGGVVEHTFAFSDLKNFVDRFWHAALLNEGYGLQIQLLTN